MSTPPALVIYETVAEYRDHYKRHLLMEKIITADDIRVYFQPERFNHAFYKSNEKRGSKEIFDTTRAKRINWIKATLENPNSLLLKGWNKYTKKYEVERRVSVVYENFVVIIEISYKRNGDELKANFITCYVADGSIEKIRKSPEWRLDEFLKKKKDR